MKRLSLIYKVVCLSAAKQTANCRDATLPKQTANCRDATLPKQTANCRDATLPKQTANCRDATLPGQEQNRNRILSERNQNNIRAAHGQTSRLHHPGSLCINAVSTVNFFLLPLQEG
ncbi:hypothetical protein [Methanosarcina siciliae]|uniref:hypothetical protein n=1 Tax=Methanosarcina siciliae TaxID=38027 RepID=UPI00064FF66F|nr:hypothetical protein [Methanosarcina siciliae]